MRSRLSITSLSAITLLTLALAAPAAAAPPPYSNAPGAQVTNVAHRGASGVAPENTLAAVEAAAGTGADLVEVDVQRSADGVLVIMHDTTLTRTTNVEEVFPDRDSYAVADFTFAELRQLDAGSWFDASFVDEPIPTLDEVIAALPAGMGLLLEVKSPELYPGLAEDIAQALAGSPGLVKASPRAQRLAVQSFNWDFIREYHQLQPNVAVGLLGGPPSDEELVEFSSFVDQINPSHTAVDAAAVERIQELGMTVNVYTVNDPERMGELIDLGVDGIITNYPALLTDVLRGGPGVNPATVAITEVVGNAPGNDVAHGAGEYVTITNISDAAVDVSDWYLRDNAYNRLDIGNGYVLDPGEILQVHSGPGEDTASRYFNDRTSSILNNGGDTVILYTPDDTVEDVFTY